ncbi:MAG TPA: hypothetical protein P5232_00320 [Candidatus Moranbacteria bacterium]|nr:hypothetical protein [Candidatus Moranbacteria bacterium]
MAGLTYSIHHSPNCKKPFEARLTGDGVGILDNIRGSNSKDICGYGETLEEAAKDVWLKKFKN